MSQWYTCNLCGNENSYAAVEAERVPGPLCGVCRSSVRFRFVGYLISREIFGGDGLLQETNDKNLKGFGLSDAMPLANALNRFEGYTNTFFHKDPKIDITDPDQHVDDLDYLISSDVFEHTEPPADLPFKTAATMLRPGGKLVLSVPTQTKFAEHFPNLHDYQVLQVGDQTCLANATTGGQLEVFHDLRFHGGPGTTLEMRIHTKQSVEDCFRNAGFSEWQEFQPDLTEYGILPVAGLSSTWIATK